MRDLMAAHKDCVDGRSRLRFVADLKADVATGGEYPSKIRRKIVKGA
jgi:hypothetical protein